MTPGGVLVPVIGDHRTIITRHNNDCARFRTIVWPTSYVCSITKTYHRQKQWVLVKYPPIYIFMDMLWYEGIHVDGAVTMRILPKTPAQGNPHLQLMYHHNSSPGLPKIMYAVSTLDRNANHCSRQPLNCCSERQHPLRHNVSHLPFRHTAEDRPFLPS